MIIAYLFSLDRQHQRMARNGACRFAEGSGRQGMVEMYCYPDDRPGEESEMK